MTDKRISPFDPHLNAIKDLERQALEEVLNYFGGDRMRMATELGVHLSAVNASIGTGRIGSYMAAVIDQHPDMPWRLEDMRKDYRNMRMRKQIRRPGTRPLTQSVA